MPCTRSTACKVSQMESRLSVPGDGCRSSTNRCAKTTCYDERLCRNLMNEILIKQSRVCDLLRSAGLQQKKKDDLALFLKYHDRIPGLVQKTTTHKPAKSGTSCWYVYETGKYLTVAQAEKEIAIAFGKLLGLSVK